jgi:hypothetical protein
MTLFLTSSQQIGCLSPVLARTLASNQELVWNHYGSAGLASATSGEGGEEASLSSLVQ